MDIPKIQIENSEIILATATFPIIVNDKEEEVTMKKISAGKRRDITKKCLKTSIVGNQMQGNMDALGFELSLLSLAIIKAPFPTDEKSLEKLPEEVVDYLYTKYQEFADSSKKKD